MCLETKTVVYVLVVLFISRCIVYLNKEEKEKKVKKNLFATGNSTKLEE